MRFQIYKIQRKMKLQIK